MLHIRVLLLCSLPLLACSDEEKERTTQDGGRHDGPHLGDGQVAAPEFTWSIEVLDTNSAGKHASIARRGKKLGIAYFRTLSTKQLPTVSCPPSGTSKPAKSAQDLYYVSFDGSAWEQNPVKVAQTIGQSYGLSLVMDQGTGKAFIGHLGGALSTVECASSDAVIASSLDGKTWTVQNLDAAGVKGDTVGYWMSVAIDSKGKAHASYRDVIYGLYEQIGSIKSSLLYDGNVVVGENGAGRYTSLALDAKDRPIIAFYNSVQSDSTGGIQLAVGQSTGWATRQLISASTAEQGLSLEGKGKGIFGLAFYNAKEGWLYYMESGSDLTAAWSKERADDSLTNTGEYPSLAYDSKGNPGISYYRCGKYGSSTCELNKDGLMFTYRLGGRWTTCEVDTGQDLSCGTYTSLVFNEKDEPVIAYSCVVYNSVLSDWVANLKVARGELP